MCDSDCRCLIKQYRNYACKIFTFIHVCYDVLIFCTTYMQYRWFSLKPARFKLELWFLVDTANFQLQISFFMWCCWAMLQYFLLLDTLFVSATIICQSNSNFRFAENAILTKNRVSPSINKHDHWHTSCTSLLACYRFLDISRHSRQRLGFYLVL